MTPMLWSPRMQEAVEALPFVSSVSFEEESGEVRIQTVRGETFSLRLVRGKRGVTRRNQLLLATRIGSSPTAANVIDRAGNLRLQLGDTYYAHIEGRRETRALPEMRGPAYCVLCAWLLEPGLLGAPLRDVAAFAEVSRSAVRDMRLRVKEWGLVSGEGRSRVWTPRGRAEARRLWLEGYRAVLRPKLDRGGFRLRSGLADPQRARAALTKLAARTRSPRWLWGGAEATRHVDAMAGYVVDAPGAGAPTVDIAVLPDVDVSVELPLVPADVSAVRVRALPFAGAARHDGLEGWPTTVPHPLLVWSELMCDPDPRSRETAKQLEERLPEGWL